MRSASRRGSVVAVFVGVVALVVPRTSKGEDHVSIKWQDYQEDDGRVRVLSKYLGVEKEVNASFAVRLHAAHDAISGATPTGATGPEGDELVLVEVTDVRDAGVVDFDWTHGIHKTSFQYAHSKESDFLSRGYAVYNTSEYNKRNTGISYGVSYIDDEIAPSFFDEAEGKESVDFFVGVRQVVDENTAVRLNLSHSRFSGYLSDPYKVASRDVEILPGLSLYREQEENRPSERNRRIVYGEATRFIPKLDAGLKASYRFFDDDWGVESHTFAFEWYQKIGDKLTLRPLYRYYRQGQADFYYRDLNDPAFRAFPDGAAYSSDYRLEKMDTETFGLKAVVELAEGWELDVSWERYKMEGRGSGVIDGTFPSAKVLTIGGMWWF